jgi:hypothetical protein
MVCSVQIGKGTDICSVMNLHAFFMRLHLMYSRTCLLFWLLFIMFPANSTLQTLPPSEPHPARG